MRGRDCGRGYLLKRRQKIVALSDIERRRHPFPGASIRSKAMRYKEAFRAVLWACPGASRITIRAPPNC